MSANATTRLPLRSSDIQRQAKAIILAAETRLGRSSVPELRRVFCTFHDGVLTLAGTVSNSYFREVARTVVEGLRGVEEIDNEIVVIPSQQHDSRNRLAGYFLQLKQ